MNEQETRDDSSNEVAPIAPVSPEWEPEDEDIWWYMLTDWNDFGAH
jgi:hypothetical protein